LFPAVDDFELSTGPLKGEKVLVDGPEYETAADLEETVVVLILI